MSAHYYLVASLPLLTYDNREATAPADFVEMLRSHLNETELELVSGARIDGSGGASANSTLASWNDFERGLRNALVRLRASNLGRDAGEAVRLADDRADLSDETAIAEAAREAATSDSPLTGEDVLSRARWAFLDELDTGHFFDLDLLITYHLRLQILARRRLFTRQEGEARFTAINEKIMNEYYQEQSE